MCLKVYCFVINIMSNVYVSIHKEIFKLVGLIIFTIESQAITLNIAKYFGAISAVTYRMNN